MTKKSSNTIFVPYTLNLLNSSHVFTKDENTDGFINGILGNSVNRELICEKWYDYFEIYLPFPFNAFVKCPIKIKNGNTHHCMPIAFDCNGVGAAEQMFF